MAVHWTDDDDFHHPEDAVPDYEQWERDRLAEEMHAERADIEHDQAMEARAEEAEQVEEWQTIIRWRRHPYEDLVAALLLDGHANVTVPPDTLLGHLGNVLQVLESAIQFAEQRVDDSDRITRWAVLTLEEAVRITTRIRGVQRTLHRYFERQAMLDSNAHADNMPF